MTISYRLVAPERPTVVATPEQGQVVAHRQSALIVLGATRTGKSTALYQAGIAALQATADRQVLLLATSRRARLQAIDLIGRLAPEVTPRFRIMTAYGLAWSIVTQYSDRVPRLLTAGRQDAHVRQLLAGAGPEIWPDELARASSSAGFASQIREQLADFSRLGKSPADLAAAAERASRADWRSLADFYQQYLDVLALESAYDYPEALLRASSYLADPAIAATVCPPGTLVLVDDAEDMAEGQLTLLDQLVNQTTPVIIAVNPDAQIYGFRGTKTRSVLTLQQTWDEREIPCQTMALTEGFGWPAAVGRSLQPQADRLPLLTGVPTDTLRAYRQPRPDRPGRIDRYVFPDASAEAHGIARLLRQAQLLGGLDPAEMAVLVRSKAQLTTYEMALLQTGLNVQVLGDELQLSLEPMVQTLLSELQARGQELAAEPTPPDWRVDDLLWQIWRDGDWESRLVAETESSDPVARQANRDLDAAVALFDLASQFTDLPLDNAIAALQSAVAASTVPEDIARLVTWSYPGVRLTTAHRAKGTAWSLVVVASVQEGIWPQVRHSQPVIDLTDLEWPLTHLSPAEQLAAERRLFSVATHAARDHLIVTAVACDDATPSRLFDQIDTAEQLPPAITGPLSAPELIAQLRRSLMDETETAGLRQAAADRLAKLASSVDARANPTRWWGVDPSPASARSANPPSDRPLNVSISQVEAILGCPRQWLLGRPAAGSVAATTATSLGSLIHRLVQEPAAPLDQMMTDLAAAWPELEWPADWLSTAGLAQAERMLARYDAWRTARGRQVLATEFEVNQTIDLDGGPVTLHGRLDRVEADRTGRCWIVDFKTGKLPTTQAETDAHLQLGLYQVAVLAGALDSLGVERLTLAGAELVYLRLDERKGSNLAKTRLQASLSDRPYLADEPTLAALTPEQAAAIGSQRQYPTWVHQRLAAARAILTTGRYPGVTGPSCRWCQFAQTCPAVGNGHD